MGTKDQISGSTDRSNSDSPEDNVIGLNRNSDDSAKAGLETIQTILFGEQVRAGNEQIEALKSESKNAMAELSERIDQRLKALTESMDSQFLTLSQQLDAHKVAQQSSDERMGHELDALKATFTQSIQSTRDDLNSQLTQALNEMQGAKLDRGKMSELFSHVAQELAAMPLTQTKT